MVFGIPIAYVKACEKQRQKTLHSHMHFNNVLDAIFSEDLFFTDI